MLSQPLNYFNSEIFPIYGISVDYTSKVGEKQFSDVRKGPKSRQSKIKVCCSWFVGPTHSPYFAAPSLQSASRNSTELQILKDEERNCKELALLPRYNTDIAWQLIKSHDNNN